LQQTAVDQLKGKHGAVVILNPQTGDVLALYSEPSYSLSEVDDEATWIRLEANERDNPRQSRARRLLHSRLDFQNSNDDCRVSRGRAGHGVHLQRWRLLRAQGANVIFDDGGQAKFTAASDRSRV
jgi:hypothetical protein